MKEPWFGWDTTLRKPFPLNWKARVLMVAPLLFGVLVIPTFVIFDSHAIFFWMALVGLAISVALKSYFVMNRMKLPPKTLISEE